MAEARNPATNIIERPEFEAQLPVADDVWWESESPNDIEEEGVQGNEFEQEADVVEFFAVRLF
ncbi:MAG: hypothetical protein AUG51_14515 [Acidobacteria bacterium 13_1_20CM_3_53_8]|nr:MAG: hypothetical protein AUG51_14515 [Acidobacteria bacterium 13_1_20CM_3_53_8]